MGSSKKHKEKRDRKKHKKGRSRSRERDVHKKSRKSSHRRDKRKSPEQATPEVESLIVDDRRRHISDEADLRNLDDIHEDALDRTRDTSLEDDFDVEKLLDSKLSENSEFSSLIAKRPSRKRRREEAIEELKKRQKLTTKEREDSLERFANEQLLEEHGLPKSSVVKPPLSPLQVGSTIENVEIPFIGEVHIKEEPLDDNEDNPAEELNETISIQEANKLRAKLGLRPLDSGKKTHDHRDSLSIDEANKLRSKLGLKPLDVGNTVVEHGDSVSVRELKTENEHVMTRPTRDGGECRRSPEALRPGLPVPGKLRGKHGVKPLDVRKNAPERNDSVGISKSKKSRSRTVLKPMAVESDIPENSESLSISDTNKLRAKLGLKPLDVTSDIPENSESLSISATNKLRAKLGLKPLDVSSDIPGIGDENAEKEISKPAAEVFVKTENISEVKRSEALREKIKVTKEKRRIEEKLRKTKGLADSDSEEESAAAWVQKHQKLLQEKEKAEKRAKLLEEMDKEFGIGALVEEEFDKKKAYTAQNLKGLTIGHHIDTFKEGHQVILTLKDKGVLEEDEDVLENVNFLDNERYAKNVEVKKKKPDYRPYEEPEFDEFGILKKKNMLSKYDEEIEGEKRKTFKIGNTGSINTTPYVSKEQELELIRMRLRQQNEMSLEMPEMKIANEYFTTEDMVLFKKPKKKKVRKASILKADDLLLEPMDDGLDFGSRKMKRQQRIVEQDEDFMDSSSNQNISGIPLIEEPSDAIDLSSVVIDEDQAEKELHSALNKARKLKQRKIMTTAPEKVIEILNSVNEDGTESQKDAKGGHIELNSVAEFCRTLGEIPTYGMSGNRDEEADEMMDLERELMEERQKQELEAQNRGAWNEVDIDEKPAEILMRENEPILEEEPDISSGVAGALKLAMKKGYLDKESKKIANAARASQLQAQSYTIEEKFYEDDKFGKRDRYTGPVQEFKDKNNYKPDVKLEYIDDSGRLLTAKEAFRYLSHKFHGKGPGKNKVDKRMKKVDQDTRLKQMSSTDTPLNTVKLLQAKQKETQSPYIVLSGGNKTLTQTMISKTKPL